MHFVVFNAVLQVIFILAISNEFHYYEHIVVFCRCFTKWSLALWYNDDHTARILYLSAFIHLVLQHICFICKITASHV